MGREERKEGGAQLRRTAKRRVGIRKKVSEKKKMESIKRIQDENWKRRKKLRVRKLRRRNT